MKFGLYKQKPLIVKFYEKHSLFPKLLYVYRCLGGAISVCAVQGCEHAHVFAVRAVHTLLQLYALHHQ
jgi:hypothetical protein